VTLRRLAHVVGLLALVVVVAPFVVYAAPGVIGADASYVVLSGSMEPTISTGDVVIVGDVAAEAVASGDVITFQREGESVPTTHRVVSVTSTAEGISFTTKGDANEEADPEPVTPDRLVGRVTFIVPVIGYVVQFVDTPLGFGLLVVLPFGLLVVTELYSLGRTARDSSDGEGSGHGSPSDGGDGGPPSGSPTTDGSGYAAPTGVADRDTAVQRYLEDDDEGVADESSSSSLVVTRTDLRTTGATTGVFAVYAVWVVTQVGVTAWAVSAAVAGVLATLFVGWVYVAVGDPPEDQSRERSDGRAALPLLPTDLSAVTPSVDRETRVDSPNTLGDMADEVDRPVLADLETNRLAVVVGDSMYLYEAPVVDTGSGVDDSSDDPPQNTTTDGSQSDATTEGVDHGGEDGGSVVDFSQPGDSTETDSGDTDDEERR
jgi:signal peptidase